MTDKQHWSVLKERGSFLGIRILVGIYKILGKHVFKACFIPVMLYFYVTGGAARRAILAYWSQLDITLRRPPTNRLNHHRHAFKVFITFGLAIVDKFDAWLGKISRQDIDIVNADCYDSLINSGGAVILSSHLGNMEICRAIFSSGEHKKKLNIITYNQHAPSFNQFLKRINPDAAINFIHIGQFGPNDAIVLKQKIDDGEPVVIFADRTSVNHPDNVKYIPFLSKPAPIAIGPFALATIMECPIYFMTCLKNSETGRYQAYVEHFADPISVKRKERQTYYQQLMQKYADRLAHYCLKEPYQWNNFFDFWQKEQPDENTPTERKQGRAG